MLKGGIIGFGKVGQGVTRTIREHFPEADIVAVCNRSEEKLKIARDEFNILVRTHDPEELCAQDLDFVMVLSSNSAHREHVELAAKYKRHIFCEKPIATTIEDGDAMVRAVDEAGVISCVMYSLRFVPMYTQLRALYQSGDLGDLISLHCLRLRGFGLAAGGARHWAIDRPAESGGWVVHHACHAIDFVYWTAGEFANAYAHTHSTAPDGVSELVLGMGRMKNGGTGIVTDSVCAAREHYMNLVGTKGTAIVRGGPDPAIEIIWERSRAAHYEPDERRPVEAGKYRHSSLQHFFECLTEGATPVATIRDARHSLAVACCMEESARTGLPVDIPPGPGPG